MIREKSPLAAALAEALFQDAWTRCKNRNQLKDTPMTKTIEYRIRPITKFIVTRWLSYDDGESAGGGSEACGEFPNEEQALTAARGLVALEPGARLVRPTPAGFDADGNRLQGDGQ